MISRNTTPMPELSLPSPSTYSSMPSPELFSSEEELTEDQLQENVQLNKGNQEPSRILLFTTPFAHLSSPSNFFNGLEQSKEEELEKNYQIITYLQPIPDDESG